MKRKIWKIAGINFDHFHMGDLLRMAVDHPQVQVVGISDEQPPRMEEAIRKELRRTPQTGSAQQIADWLAEHYGVRLTPQYLAERLER